MRVFWRIPDRLAAVSSARAKPAIRAGRGPSQRFSPQRRADEFRGSRRSVKVGRQADSELCLQDNLVSREHALLHAQDGKVKICDRGSSNGTFLNGEQLKPNQWYEVKVGSKLKLGQTELKLHGPESTVNGQVARNVAHQGLSTALQAAPAVIGGPAGALMQIIDFRELVADPQKQLEKFGQLVPDKPNAYWQNNAEARMAIRGYLDKGDFSNLRRSWELASATSIRSRSTSTSILRKCKIA